MNFPGGPGVKNLPAVLGDRVQFLKIPHAAEQLGPRATTTGACAPRACAAQLEKPLQ